MLFPSSLSYEVRNTVLASGEGGQDSEERGEAEEMLIYLEFQLDGHISSTSDLVFENVL